MNALEHKQHCLPERWAWTTLGEVCHKPEYGWTTAAVRNQEGLKLLRTTDITSGCIDWSTVPSCAEVPQGEKFRLRAGDIVISRAGSVGYSALIGDCPDSVFASYLMRFRPVPDVEPRYVSYFLLSPSYWSEIAAQASGIALSNVNAKKLSTVKLPLPPLPEQHRIVAEIETQFTRLDASVAALKRAQANLKRYRASVLKAACDGKLVPNEAELARQEGRDYEPASALLERILQERRARWEAQEKRRGQYKEPAAPDSSGLPELPEGWVWATVGQLTTLVTKGSSPGWQGYKYVEFGIKFLRSQNVRWGTLDLTDLAYLPEEFNGTHTNSIIHDGDVLLNLVGASVGRSAVANHEIEGANTNQAVGIIRPVHGEVLGTFLMYCFISPQGQNHITSTKVDVARANFNLDDIRPTPIPLPTLAEQRRIIAEVERRLSVIQAAENIVAANLKRSERLRQSILKQAFSGKLVPQDPNDEPASALLERIRAERAAATKGPEDRKRGIGTQLALREAK